MTESLLQWALDATHYHDHPTLPARKRALLADLNRACGTAYKLTHLNAWLAGRKKLPGPAWRYLAAEHIRMTLLDRPCDAIDIIEMLGLRP